MILIFDRLYELVGIQTNLRKWELLTVLTDCMDDTSPEHSCHAYYFTVKIWKYDLENNILSWLLFILFETLK